MSNLAPVKSGALATLTDEQVDILRDTLFKGFGDEEIKFCVAVSNRTGLDPFSRQIHFRKQKDNQAGKDRIVIITGIDGFRLSAQRSGAYAGSDDISFDAEDKPKRATATVYKIVQGVRCPFTATVRWNEFYPGDKQGHMWRKMPTQMLGKCAEAQALRKAFPAELSGVYLKEEMDQADNDQTLIKTKAEEVTAELAKPVNELPASRAQEFTAEEFFDPVNPDDEIKELGDYIVKAGRNKGARLRDIRPADLVKAIAFLDQELVSGKSFHSDVLEFKSVAESFLRELEEKNARA